MTQLPEIEPSAPPLPDSPVPRRKDPKPGSREYAALHPLLDADGAIAADVPCSKCRYNLRTLKLDRSCPECGQSIATSLIDTARRVGPDDLTLPHMSWFGRVCYLLAGVLLPIPCFALASLGKPGPTWQSGRWGDYVALLLGGPQLWVFFPWLFYAMVSMACVVMAPRRLGRNRWLRLGVYCGIPLALQYGFVEGITLGAEADRAGWGLFWACVALSVAGVIVLAIWGFNRLRKRVNEKTRNVVAGITLGLALVALVLGGSGVVFVTAPLWTLVAFTLLSIRLWRTVYVPGRRTPRWLVLVPAWFTGWGGSWAAAIALAMDHYARLPSAPPPGNCYVCTAAARGHPRIVGTGPRIRVMNDGNAMPVNRQMQRLKAAEIALAVVWPRGHHALRNAYDRVGPPLARRISRPLLADAAYVALKPAEWLAAAVLVLLVPRSGQLVDGLYRATRDEQSGSA